MNSLPQPRVEYRPYRLPFLRPLRTAHGLWRERCGVLVRSVDERGCVHYTEHAPLPWSSSPAFSTDGEATPSCQIKLPKGAAPVPAAAAALELAALLPAGRAALAALRERGAAGFRVFKWKVAVGSVDEELALLDELCAALPAGARLRLDANGGWSQREAERWLARCAALGEQLEFVEQPLLAAPHSTEREQRRTDDILLGLARDYPTPQALDESLGSDADVRRWLERGWSGLFVLKPTLLENPAAVLGELARAGAAAAGGGVVFSSALETAVGAREALRWAFAWASLARESVSAVQPVAPLVARRPYALGFGVWPLFAQAVFNGPKAQPWLRAADVEAIDVEAAWNALS